MSTAITMALLGLVLAAFRRWMPASQKATTPPSEEVQQLYLTYRRWHFLYLGLFLIFCPLCSLGVFALFMGLEELLALSRRPYLFLLTPGWVLWGTPALLLGILLTSLPLKWIFQSLLREKNLEFQTFQDRIVGFDNRKVLPIVIGFTLVLVVPVVWIGARTYTAVRDTGITVQPPLRLHPITYRYDQVRAVGERFERVMDNGIERAVPIFFIRFTDGREWTNGSNIRGDDRRRDWRITLAIADRAGLPVTSVDPRPDPRR